MHGSSSTNVLCTLEAIKMNVYLISSIDIIIDRYLKVNMNTIKLLKLLQI